MRISLSRLERKKEVVGAILQELICSVCQGLKLDGKSSHLVFSQTIL